MFNIGDLVQKFMLGQFNNHPATGSPFVILWNTPECPAYATSQPVTTTANEGD